MIKRTGFKLSVTDRICLRLLGSKAQANRSLYPHRMAVFAHDHIGNHINVQGVYEGHLLYALFAFLSPLKDEFSHGSALDIGANIGNHTLWFADRFSKVLAFEPHPRTFDLLQFNTEPLSNVECARLAMGAAEGTAKLNDMPGNIGGSSILGASKDKGHLISVETVDGLNYSGAQPKLIKIDVEGFEMPVLQGAEQTIDKFRPVVVFEQLAREFDGQETPAIRWLRERGYQIWWNRHSQIRRKKLARLMNFSKEYDVEMITGERIPTADHSMLVACSSETAERLGN